MTIMESEHKIVAQRPLILHCASPVGQDMSVRINVATCKEFIKYVNLC